MFPHIRTKKLDGIAKKVLMNLIAEAVPLFRKNTHI